MLGNELSLIRSSQAAARHQCSFLVKMHVQEFYQMGVCVEWLNGLQYAPQRLRNLNEINKLLAHRPWLITKDHIQVSHMPLLWIPTSPMAS